MIKWKFWQSNEETKKVIDSVNERVLADTYKKLERELDSLRKYDRGEKKIDAPDLRTVVRRVQRTV